MQEEMNEFLVDSVFLHIVNQQTYKLGDKNIISVIQRNLFNTVIFIFKLFVK